ncbi:MAG: hypothetical protein CMJ18_21860 [Phycisphaeraceae bacterium]|nr:hypothetical protein [Phycisphaeraceae bacterium]
MKPIPLLSVVLILASIGTARADSHRPSWKWQIRSGHVGLSNDLTMLPNMARAGMNAVMVGFAEHFVGHDGKPTMKLADSRQLESIEHWARECEKIGFGFFPGSNVFGTGDRIRWKLDRTYVTLKGENWPNTPCPNDAEFWRRKNGNVFVELAKWSRDKPAVAGLYLDTEMYGADRSGFPDACFCEPCRKEIAAELHIDVAEMNLDDATTLSRYREISTRLLEKIFTRIRVGVHDANPNLELGAYLLDSSSPDGVTPPFYKAMTLAWGTPRRPVLVYSESTYTPGYHAAYTRPGKPLVRPTGSFVDGKASPFGIGTHPGYIEEWIERWEQWGAHAHFVGGIWIDRIPEENFAENLYHMGRHVRGYWIYDLLSLGDNPQRALPGNGLPAYLDAITHANRELDRTIKSDGSYRSPLKVRPFTLPAPGVSSDEWTRLDLPRRSGPSASPQFMVRAAEVVFAIPAEAGDEVRMTILADTAHPYKKKAEAIAIVAVDPSGKQIMRDKLVTEDMDKMPRTDRRYGGQRAVSFRAEQAGTYGLYLNGSRYAYTLHECSHRWVARLDGRRGLRFWHPKPKKIYLQTEPDADEIRLFFGKCSSTNVRVSDSGGSLLAEGRFGGKGGEMKFPLPARGRQVLTVTMEGGFLTTFRDAKGCAPLIGASSDAPFPTNGN